LGFSSVGISRVGCSVRAWLARDRAPRETVLLLSLGGSLGLGTSTGGLTGAGSATFSLGASRQFICSSSHICCVSEPASKARCIIILTLGELALCSIHLARSRQSRQLGIKGPLFYFKQAGNGCICSLGQGFVQAQTWVCLAKSRETPHSTHSRPSKCT